MALIQTKEKKNYISILNSDASLRKTVDQNTSGAKLREWDVNGNKGSKWELEYNSVSGKITDINFLTTKIGTLLQIDLTDEFLNDTETLSLGLEFEYAKDFMIKLPNIDLEKEVVIKPYRFTPEGGKELTGLSITQDGNKIEKSFREPIGKKTAKGFPEYKETMGMPTYSKTLNDEKNDMKRKEGQKRYYKDVDIFLVDYTTENFVSKFDKALVEEKLDEETEVPEGF